jgi:cysteine-rich repeat protein
VSRALNHLAAAVVVVLAAGPALGGTFIFAGEANGVDVVTHPPGYSGSGGALGVSVCIDPSSPNASQMSPAVQRAIATWNAQLSTTGNLVSGTANDVPSGTVDFESVFVHELGHCIGLAHVNVASESGLPLSQQDYTQSTMGADGAFDTGAGSDGIQGSSDDQRDDDVNLHWFEIGVNDPFQGPATVFDATTFSRLLSDLPGSHDYVANAARAVGAALGVPNTEAVMQQLTFFDEAQRSLTRDDIATLRYAMSGIDEIAGTSDDYTLSLSYAGLSSSCDIVVDFDDVQTEFAVCITGGAFIADPPPGPPTATDHVEITSAEIFFNNGFNWYFDVTCGDDVTGGSETCDDGGTSGGDGCDAVCQLEPGYQCSGEPSVCGTTCGDGLIAGAETCDDGGTSGGDGCDAVCQLEPGYQCSGEPSTCSPTTSVPMLGGALRGALALLLAGVGVLAGRRRLPR